jgi:DNA-binding beta-propeller fold protein YncE
VSRLLDGRRDAVIGTITGGGQGRVYVQVTQDDRMAFVANESSASISVIDLARARTAGFDSLAILGAIPTGRAPIALTLSPDEQWLYATSQVAPPSPGLPVDCLPQGWTTGHETPDHTRGAIFVIDVARARRDPAGAVVGTVPAGCNPVRLVLSPDGRIAWVSARTDNALLAFDTGRLRSDPAHAQLAAVPVGTAPVGVAVVRDGSTVLVTNSNRFAGGTGDRQTVTVVDARHVREGGARVTGAIPAGAFPREMRVAPDGRTLLLTNFNSSNLQVVDLARLEAVLIRDR